MTQDERLEILSSIAMGLSKIMGNDTEVAVHDLQKMELNYVANGYITDRKAGCPLEDGVTRSIEKLSDGDGHLVGYESRTTKGKKLRSSHMLFRDDNGECAAMLCINQDTTSINDVIQHLTNLIRINVQEDGEENLREDEDYIQRMTQEVILRTAEMMNPMELTTKEGKMELLRRLKVKGVFDVKDAVPFICNVISVSQATLYNYLRDLRLEEEQEPIEQLKVK
jgi:D-arginine utilization repressor